MVIHSSCRNDGYYLRVRIRKNSNSWKGRFKVNNGRVLYRLRQKKRNKMIDDTAFAVDFNNFIFAVCVHYLSLDTPTYTYKAMQSIIFLANNLTLLISFRKLNMEHDDFVCLLFFWLKKVFLW